MYSMVLLAALTTGSNAPDCFFRSGCHGCQGGCHGCYGGCHGCYGGGYGGCGGCYGGGSYGGGCWGGSYGASCYGAHGCFGGTETWLGGCSGYGEVVVEKGTRIKKKQVKSPVEEGEEVKEDQSLIGPARAKIVIDLPSDARLFIDDRPMRTTSGHREFKTPLLKTNDTYYYILRAEVVRGGETIERTKRVVVRPGAEIYASFDELNDLDAAND